MTLMTLTKSIDIPKNIFKIVYKFKNPKDSKIFFRSPEKSCKLWKVFENRENLKTAKVLERTESFFNPKFGTVFFGVICPSRSPFNGNQGKLRHFPVYMQEFLWKASCQKPVHKEFGKYD